MAVAIKTEMFSLPMLFLNCTKYFGMLNRSPFSTLRAKTSVTTGLYETNGFSHIKQPPKNVSHAPSCT